MARDLNLSNFKMLGEMMKEKANTSSLADVEEMNLTEFMYDLGQVMAAIWLTETGKISVDLTQRMIDLFNGKWKAVSKELLGYDE